MRKSFVVCILIFTAMKSFAVQTITHRPEGRPLGLVVIAPAKKYLMEERLFTELAKSLALKGFVSVRFNWSDETLKDAKFEIPRATQEIEWVISQAQKIFGFSAQKTVLVSKSFSTKALGSSLSLARYHVLLTPNCSTQDPFQSSYSQILGKGDIDFRIFISVEDPYCDVRQIYQALTAKRKLEKLRTTRGDHNFVIHSRPGPASEIYRYQDFVIEDVVSWVQQVTR